MERLKAMKNQLIAQVQTQLNDIHSADCDELGAAVDMIKDIAETEYYCSIVKAMEEKEEEEKTERYYYTERYMPIPYQRTLDRDMDRHYGKMYYDEPHMEHDRMYYEQPYEIHMRDPREGKSAPRRKMYMESKEMHQPKEKSMHELDLYMQELTGDITDMIHDATPEERQLLQNKLQTLIAKIDQVK